jgi:ubiquinone/menaquinone biosynthesis C-methylase UbiE
MRDDAFNKWSDFHTKLAANTSELLWPSETLVRLFKGNYVPGLDKQYKGRTLLDVGFGNGNNLIFLASLGLTLAGTEVTPEICDMVRGRLQRIGHHADLRVGTNRQLPFPDHSFDFLTSWNVIHYEDTENKVRAAIAEYQRVLKPGGRFFLSTTGPEHKILQNGKTLGGHRYQIGRADDFRKGQVYFYFDAPNDVRMYFGEKFRDVLVGRTHDMLLTETLDWFIVTGVKP